MKDLTITANYDQALTWLMIGNIVAIHTALGGWMLYQNATDKDSFCLDYCVSDGPGQHQTTSMVLRKERAVNWLENLFNYIDSMTVILLEKTDDFSWDIYFNDDNDVFLK